MVTNEGADIDGGWSVSDATEAEARGVKVSAVGKGLCGLAPTGTGLAIETSLPENLPNLGNEIRIGVTGGIAATDMSSCFR